MANSFFNKLTSSLNMQKDDDGAADFYQALDEAQQGPGQEEAGNGAGEEYQEDGSSADVPETEEDEGGEDGTKEGEEMDEGDAEPVAAHLAMARSTKGGVKERAHRSVLSPLAALAQDEAEGQLAIDVYQTENDIVIKSVIAGVQPEDLDITIGEDTVTIRGSRKKDEKVSNENYFYQECYWGAFSRSVILPVEIDRERAEASFKSGILTIKLPKLEKNRTKKIPIAME